MDLNDKLLWYNNTIKILMDKGFKATYDDIEIIDYYPYYFTELITKNFMCQVFFNSEGKCSNGMESTFALDYERYFDKPRNCTFCIEIPKNQTQLDFLSEKIDWFNTKEGKEVSKKEKIEEYVREYPKGME